MSNDTQKPVIRKENGEEIIPGAVVVNQIILRSVDRTPKDIRTWRDSHQAAENIYYPNRSRLYDLYDDVMLDGHLTGIISKRIDAVLNKAMRFVNNDQKVDEMDVIIESEMFRNIMVKILESKLQGISGLEFIPGKEICFEEIPRKHIKPERGVIAKEQSELTGIEYAGIENVWIIGQKKDLGLLLKCAPYALWKRGDFADWAQYVEIFGQPVRVIKYDANDIKTKMELQTVVDEAGSSLALLIPKQADFEMMDGKQSNGDGALQATLKDACNNEMSVIILGNTETTTSSKTSGYAQSKEHGKQQIEVTKSDLKFVINHLNSEKFLRILQTYGLPVLGGRFEFEGEVDLDELAAKKDIDLAISNKVPIDDDYWYDTYKIPKPDNYEVLKAKMEEEKLLKLQPKTFNIGGNGKTKPPKSGNKGGGKNEPGAKSKLKFWDKLRVELADFFDPAPQGLENLSGLSHTEMVQQLSDLYKPDCCNTQVTLAAFDDLEEMLLTMVKRIYRIKGMPPGIDKNVTAYYFQQLWEAVTKGFGSDLVHVDYDTPDGEMLQKLQVNVSQFSAAKNYQQLKSLSQALYEDGKVRSFSQFKQAAFEINNQHVKTWLEAEYNLGVASGQMAATWSRVEQSKDTLPLLKYITAHDDRVRQSHRELDGIVRPVNDGFWDLYYPPNGWNCRCDVQQLSGGKVTNLDNIATPDNVPDLFKVNLGKRGLAFPPNHPYYDGVPEDILKAR